MAGAAVAGRVGMTRPVVPSSGALSPGSLVRILGALHTGRLTGVLQLSRNKEALGLRFLDGHVVSGGHGPVGRLGDILVRCGYVSGKDLEAALRRAAAQGRRLGPVLVEERLVTRQQVQEALRLQVRDVLFAALFWGFGAYRFDPDEGPAGQEEISLEISTTSLVFEVASSLESPDVILAGLADLDAPLQAVADAGEGLRRDGARLSPADGYVLSRADGLTSLRQAVDMAPLAREAVERSLVALLCCGAVGVRPGARRDRLSPDATLAVSRAALGLDGDWVAREKRAEAERLLRDFPGRNHFEVLGLAAGADPDAVKRAYLRLARQFHPDQARDAALADVCKAVFLRVSEAYNVLTSPDSRARYEASLGRPAEVVAAPAESPASPGAVPLPEPADALLQAEDLIAAQKPFEAASLLEDVLPHLAGRLRTRARLLRVRAHLKTPSGARPAEAELREILQEDASCLEACLLLGELYYDHGMQRRAAAQFRRALELCPDHPLAGARLQASTQRSAQADAPASAMSRARAAV